MIIVSKAAPLRLLLVAVSAPVMLALAGCGSGGGTAPEASKAPAKVAVTGPTVTLKSLMIMPEVLRVKVGATVTWVNAEPITHTVTSGRVTGIDATSGLRSGQKADGRFNHTLDGKGDSFSYTFTRPGTYSYYCSIHFGMNAEVVVTK